MSYIINTYNGTQLTVIADGTVDNTTTELTLIGKNYSGYGTLQNDNFVYLLENFANVSAPTKPVAGQLWFDSSVNKLKLYDKNLNWRTISGADTSTGEPSYLTEGDFWFDTINKQLYVYSSTGYNLIGPPQTNSGNTSFETLTVTDTNSNTHEIIAASVNGTTIFTVSTDATFTLLPNISAISGFIDIHPGITLVNTADPLNPGYTTPGVVASYKFYGTSSNTDTMNISLNGGGIKPAVQATVAVPTSSDKTSIVSRDNLGDIYVNNLHGDVIGTATKALTMQVNNGTTLVNDIQATTFIPDTTDKTSIVSRDAVGDIYANIFNGTATKANTLLVSGYYYEASINTILNGITGSNIAVRDNAGDIYANIFHGTATTAQYADLAEKYLADQEYEFGTVVMVGGDKEVIASIIGARAIGVVSENPAFMMNTDLKNGTYIALKGRVPVKVNGIVKKGDSLVPDNNGVARIQSNSSEHVFAISLENSDITDTKLIEAVIL